MGQMSVSELRLHELGSRSHDRSRSPVVYRVSTRYSPQMRSVSRHGRHQVVALHHIGHYSAMPALLQVPTSSVRLMLSISSSKPTIQRECELRVLELSVSVPLLLRTLSISSPDLVVSQQVICSYELAVLVLPMFRHSHLVVHSIRRVHLQHGTAILDLPMITMDSSYLRADEFHDLPCQVRRDLASELVDAMLIYLSPIMGLSVSVRSLHPLSSRSRGVYRLSMVRNEPAGYSRVMLLVLRVGLLRHLDKCVQEVEVIIRVMVSELLLPTPRETPTPRMECMLSA